MDIKSSTWLIERLRSQIELLIAHILNFELRIRHNERERESEREETENSNGLLSPPPPPAVMKAKVSFQNRIFYTNIEITRLGNK